MEMLFQINTRYNYLVGDTNNTQDEYHYTINEQKNQLLLSNNTFSFNRVINESNSNLFNSLVNKQIKEINEFNVLYLGKNISSPLKNILNDISSNKRKTSLLVASKLNICSIYFFATISSPIL